MQLQYENPKRVKGSFVWRVNSRFLSSSELKGKLGSSLEDPKLLQKLIKKYGNKLYLVSGSENKNKFFVWFSRIKDWENQKNVNVKYSLEPNKTYKDKENNNLIDFLIFQRN